MILNKISINSKTVSSSIKDILALHNLCGWQIDLRTIHCFRTPFEDISSDSLIRKPLLLVVREKLMARTLTMMCLALLSFLLRFLHVGLYNLWKLPVATRVFFARYTPFFIIFSFFSSVLTPFCNSNAAIYKCCYFETSGDFAFPMSS